MHGSALLQLRARVWVLLQDPDSSIWSYRLSMLFLLTVFLSTLVLCVSTMPEVKNKDLRKVMDGTETVCIMLFTLEFVVKALCAPSVHDFMWDPMNTIDLVSFLPWYIDVIMCAFKACSTDSFTLKITQVCLLFPR